MTKKNIVHVMEFVMLPKEGDTLFRVEAQAMAFNVRLFLDEYIVLRVTKCGFWVGKRGSFSDKRWFRNDTRFVSATPEDAFQHLANRKKAHAKFAQARAEDAARMARATQELLHDESGGLARSCAMMRDKRFVDLPDSDQSVPEI